ncbi:hypothetical protein [Rhizohabitans arisaemae]|uniref:hypothetical protein n=1 Tax=Rhizohabitans arisaemae TaxID=2720610 RepID=UPI0024B27E7E|nr:hypothetical protein [Rhizohabitans arisaemae]
MTATAVVDPATGEVRLTNDLIRLRVHKTVGPFGKFPKGYTGYTLELKQSGTWVPMARARYMSAIWYRSDIWGRDFLHYIIPETVTVNQVGGGATATFTHLIADFDNVLWEFTFYFGLAPNSNLIEANYYLRPSAPRKLLQFWGPKLYVGEGSFQGARDEALLPGLEYLGATGRSSANPGISPDARHWFNPNPRKVTLPVMAVRHEGRMVGLMWEPTAATGVSSSPSIAFASPNWLEGKDNHLLGVFLPGVPGHVAENGLRAHTPAQIAGNQTIVLPTGFFAKPATRIIEALEYAVTVRSGLPAPLARPHGDSALLELLATALTTTSWDPATAKWHHIYGWNTPTPEPATIISLTEVAPMLPTALATAARNVAAAALTATVDKTLPLALRTGGIASVLSTDRTKVNEMITDQLPDGGWTRSPTEEAEHWLHAQKGQPEPGHIWPPNSRGQGITATYALPVLNHALITGDSAVVTAGLKAVDDLDTYHIPGGLAHDEMPEYPSLHGAFWGIHCYLNAYQLTGNPAHLARAVYFARTALAFVYLWSYGPQPVPKGLVHPTEVNGTDLFQQPNRDVMRYGALVGYGASQYQHHWLGILVQWVGLVACPAFLRLSPLDNSQPWGQIAEGIMNSTFAQMYDKGSYNGYWPDAFNLETWVPSGPTIFPGPLLDVFLYSKYGKDIGARTGIVRDATRRIHVTSSVQPGSLTLLPAGVRFTLQDPNWTHVRAIVAGLTATSVTVDGTALTQVIDLESADQCWSVTSTGLVLVKVRVQASPRLIQVQ